MYDLYQMRVEDTLRYQGVFTPLTSYKDDLSLQQAYFNWQHRFSDRFRMTLGLHQQYFFLGKHNSIEPRLGLKYELRPGRTLNFGAGLHSQLQPITVYFNKTIDSDDLPNTDLDFTRALHLVLGYDHFFSEQLRFKTELYYQYLYRVPVSTEPSSFSMLNEGGDFVLTRRTDLVNEGTGYNYGLELTLERFFHAGYYFLTTASLFESKYKGSDGVLRNTLFNGNYVFNVLGGKEFSLGANTSLSFDARLTYAGGRRYTPILLEESIAKGEEVLDDEHAFSEQLPDYFKLDFKLTFRLNGKRVAQEWAVDLTNLTNHKNVFRQTYNARLGQLETTYQRGFFPNVQYRILF